MAIERARDAWGNCGEVVGWDPPIKLSCPSSKLSEVGGWHLFKRDRDGATLGIHPNKITFCNHVPNVVETLVRIA